VEYSPVARVNVMAADLAGICPPLGHRVKLAALLADGAICGRAPILDFHELGQTRCMSGYSAWNCLKVYLAIGAIPYLGV
jgi:hypothetical protein